MVWARHAVRIRQMRAKFWVRNMMKPLVQLVQNEKIEGACEYIQCKKIQIQGTLPYCVKCCLYKPHTMLGNSYSSAVASKRIGRSIRHDRYRLWYM